MDIGTFLLLAGAGMIGGICNAVAGAGLLVGATLLVFTGEAQFSRLVPWPILVATVLFVLGPWLRQAIERHARGQVPLLAAEAEFLTALYGGYFGAGLGIMLMAILTLSGVRDVQEASAVKNAMATVVTGAAVMLFVATRSIARAQGRAVLLGAIVGGHAGARLARWIPPLAPRWTIMATGLALAAYFGLKAGA